MKPLLIFNFPEKIIVLFFFGNFLIGLIKLYIISVLLLCLNPNY
jgi:hypothetical protein